MQSLESNKYFKFRTQYDRVEIFSDHGNPIVEDFIGKYDAQGRIVLEKTGEHNLYNEIQSHKDSCDINLIVKRFASGETDVLSKIQGMYGDFTDLPKTYADMLNSVIAGENFFMSLPIDIRAKFNHNFAEFMAEMNTDIWNEKMGFSENSDLISEKIVVEKEVKEDA